MEYGPMSVEELRTCALLAAEAFYSYEYFSIYIPDDQRRKHFLDALIACEFKTNWGDPESVFLTARENGKVVAVAQLSTPRYVKPSDADYIRHGWLGVMLKGGIRQVNAWNDMEKLASAPCHRLKEDNWYLSLLTVEKSGEGKGTGSRFLKECLIPYARNAGGKTFSLFTNSEGNCRFYENNGFSLFDEKEFEHRGRKLGSWSYCMEL